MRLRDRTGDRVGRLTVMHRQPAERGKRPHWVCRCDCGTVKTIKGADLSKISSCGCYLAELRHQRATHGMTRTGEKKPSEYIIWASMKARCLNTKSPSYKDYGGRGIKVCQEWSDSFESFFSYVGRRPHGMTLDRYPDNDGNYEPGNVRWATPTQQANNRRQRKNTRFADLPSGRVSVPELVEKTGLKYTTVWYMVRNNRLGRLQELMEASA